MFILKLSFSSLGSGYHVLQHRKIFGVNTTANQFECHGQAWVKVENGAQFRRPDDLILCYRPRKCAGFAEALTIGEERLAALPMLLGALEIVDVGICAIPADDLSAFISKRLGPN